MGSKLAQDRGDEGGKEGKEGLKKKTREERSEEWSRRVSKGVGLGERFMNIVEKEPFKLFNSKHDRGNEPFIPME